MPFIWVLIGLILAEIAVFVWIGGVIGVWAVLALVILSALLGMTALRGRLVRLGALARAGDEPAALLAGGAMTVLGAGLLILPGFLTDAAGLALLLPPVQRWVGARFAARLAARRGGATIIEGEFRAYDSDPPRSPPRPLPPRGH